MSYKMNVPHRIKIMSGPVESIRHILLTSSIQISKIIDDHRKLIDFGFVESNRHNLISLVNLSQSPDRPNEFFCVKQSAKPLFFKIWN